MPNPDRLVFSNTVNIRVSANPPSNLRIEFTIGDLDTSRNTTAGSDPNQQVRITNRTGYTIFYVYVSSVTSDSWGEDILGRDVLLNGKFIDVRLPQSLNLQNRYDIMLKDSDGDTYTRRNVLIRPNSTLEFTIRDLD